MATRKIAVDKKYVVRLSAEERRRLDAMIHAGKRSAQLLMKARILLKADASEKGPDWNDGQIVEALDTSRSTVSRVRQQLTAFAMPAIKSASSTACAPSWASASSASRSATKTSSTTTSCGTIR